MLSEPMAGWIVIGLGIYVGFGALFGLFFVLKGVHRARREQRPSEGRAGRIVICPLRIRHRWMIGAIGLAVGVLLVLGLLARRAADGT
ncbi:MAG: hypothetical protein VYE73_01865 [Acidobacteriota bacterium]|nr:hypothetical protein [Acidobacteriota bacterium]